MMIRKQINNMSLQKQNRNTEVRSPFPSGEVQRTPLGGLRVSYIKWIMILPLFVMTACNRKPFVDHKLKFEKISGNCQNLKPSFRMVSNVAGERYEFEKCLGANFTKDMMEVSRQGDTVLVQFPKPVSQSVLYKITLDVDSYPRYNFITVDDETFIVTSSKD
jgi:hypothetical protein